MVSYFTAALALLSATASAGSVRRLEKKPIAACGAKSSNDFVSYTPGQGDTLGGISRGNCKLGKVQAGRCDFNVKAGICDIAKANGLVDPNNFQAGVVLYIPKCTRDLDNTSCTKEKEKTKPTTNTCVNGVGSSYNVRKDDTFHQIADFFNITSDSLKASNPNVQPNAIAVDQTLAVPICPESCCDWIGTYTIQTGDLLIDLAKNYTTTVGQILSVNHDILATALQPNTNIVLPKFCKK